MTKMTMLWMSLGLSAVGFLLIWWGSFAEEWLLWIGLIVFVIGTLLGPATRYAGK